MESGSATTRSFRSRISLDRGPGIAVLSSIVFVVAMRLTIAQSAAALHTCIGELQTSVDHVLLPATLAGLWPAITRRQSPPSLLLRQPSLSCERVRPLAWCSRPRDSAALLAGALTKSRRGQRLDRVDTLRVPQHEALRVLEPGGLDLVLNVRERVGTAQGEVLEPRDQLGRLASHRRPEIAERIGHRRARSRLRIDDVVLARDVMGGIDHWVDRIHVARDPAGELADPEVPLRRQSEGVHRDAHSERPEAFPGVPGEHRDRPTHRLGMLPRIANLRDVAVTGEPDVVELDLVEAELGRLLGDVDVVLPDVAVVGVRPAESRIVEPARAVGTADRELRRACRQGRILERDHPADEIETGGVDLGDRALGVVVALGRADPPGEWGVDRKAHLALLVLDVELERVEARRLHR